MERERGPAVAGACRDSAAVLRDQSPGGVGGLTYVAWWRLRDEGSADLVAATSQDGERWSAAVVLDSADVGHVGCARPVPGIWVDGDNVHIVYSMKAREGPGVFLSHSMDRGRTFHSPVAVVYGERLARASVSASGSFVIVAYEDPNTTPTRISIALSTTMAHLFEYREVISPEDASASDPTIVADGQRVMVTWRRGGDTTKVITRTGMVR